MSYGKYSYQLSLFLFSYLGVSLLIPTAYADEGYEGAESLGWASVGIGLLANVPFVIYNRIRKIPASIIGQSTIRELALIYKPMLTFHITLNVIGYTVGALHGILLIEYLDSISLSLAIVMSVLVTSGILLRYTSSRNLKIFNRLMHGQALLALLLVILVVLHIATAED